MNVDSIILGDDLNFTLGASNIWGPKDSLDSLSNYFIQNFEENDLVDIEPAKLNPSWRNNELEMIIFPLGTQ